MDNKWTIEQLRNQIQSLGHNFEKLWHQIERIIVLTCLHLCMVCPDTKNCFELMGFDIMVDKFLKPWLLEVNSSPALAMDGVADSRVKPDLLRDTLQLVNFEPVEVLEEK